MPRRPNLEWRVNGPYFNKTKNKWGLVVYSPISGASGSTDSAAAGEDGKKGAGKKTKLMDEEWMWDWTSEEDAVAAKQTLIDNRHRLKTFALENAIKEYLHWYRNKHPNRDTWKDIQWRLKLFFGAFDVVSMESATPEVIQLSDVTHISVSSFSTDDLKRRFTALCYAIAPLTKKPYAIDTHHDVLKEVKYLFNFCVDKGWIDRNPAAPIKYDAKKSKGKEQLDREDDAWLWLETALTLANAPEPNPTKEELSELIPEYSFLAIARYFRVSDVSVRKWAVKYGILELAKTGRRKEMVVPGTEEVQWAGGRGKTPGVTPQGALAALMTFIFAARSGEVTHRLVQCVDSGGTVLNIKKYDIPEKGLFWQPKSERGNRKVKIPDLIRPAVLKLVEGRDRYAPLFESTRGGGFFGDGWVNKQVKRICDVAGLKKITAHGMRGTHSSLTAPHAESIDILVDLFGHAKDGKVMKSGTYASTDSLVEQNLNQVWSRFEEHKQRKQAARVETTKQLTAQRVAAKRAVV